MLRILLIALPLLAAGCNLFSQTPDGIDSDMGVRDMDTREMNAPDLATPDVWVPTDIGADEDTGMLADVGDMPGDDFGAPDDMGSMDSGPDMATDTGVDAGDDMAPDMSGDPCLWPETVFCDGFEDPLLAPWAEIAATDGTWMSTAFRHRSGLAAVRFDTTADGASVAIGTTLSVPLQAPNAYWLRTFVNLPSAVGDDIALFAGITDVGVAIVGVGITPMDMTAISDSGLGGFHTEDASPPRDQWVCVEALFDLGPGGRIQAYYDGQQVIDEDMMAGAAPPMSNLFIGFDGGTGARGHMDDIIVSTIRPGCN